MPLFAHDALEVESQAGVEFEQADFFDAQPKAPGGQGGSNFLHPDGAVTVAAELGGHVQKPDVVVMDLMMPNCGGVEATQLLQVELPQINILVLTVSDKEADLFAAIKAGAKGYILKDAEPEELSQAIFHIAKGGVIVSSSMAEKLLTEFKAEEGHKEEDDSGLSRREGEVLQLVAKGASNKEIARDLFISENTVKTHLRNILDKLHLANRSQAVAYAIRTGLLPREDAEPS